MKNNLNIQILQAPRFKFSDTNQVIYLMGNKITYFVLGYYLVVQIAKRSSHPYFCYMYLDAQKGQITAFVISEGLTNISNFEYFVSETKHYWIRMERKEFEKQLGYTILIPKGYARKWITHKYYYNNNIQLLPYKWKDDNLPEVIKNAHSFLSINLRKLEKYQNLNINQIFNKNIIDFNKYAISRLNNLVKKDKDIKLNLTNLVQKDKDIKLNLTNLVQKDKYIKPKLIFTSLFNISFISYFIMLGYLLYRLLILFNQIIITFWFSEQSIDIENVPNDTNFLENIKNISKSNKIINDINVFSDSIDYYNWVVISLDICLMIAGLYFVYLIFKSDNDSPNSPSTNSDVSLQPINTNEALKWQLDHLDELVSPEKRLIIMALNSSNTNNTTTELIPPSPIAPSVVLFPPDSQ